MSTIQTLKPGKKIKLSLTVIYEIFYRDGYGIYNCEMEDGGRVVIKGNFPLPLHLQQIYEVEGKVVLRSFEPQIEVSAYQSVQPKGSYKVVAYLQQLPGLKKRAEKIYDVFGDNSIQILKKEPEKVAQAIKGIGLKKAQEWQQELLKKESEEKDILFLLNLGLSGKQATRLIDAYGSRIRKQIKENPYILLSVPGVSSYGFLKCDELAKKMGFDFGHPARMKEGVIYCLKEAARAGHTFLPKELLLESMQQVLGITLTVKQMKDILKEGRTEIQVHSRTFKIDLADLDARIKKIDSLIKDSAKEKYRYPLFRVETKHMEEALDELEKEGKICITLNRVALSYYEEAEEKISEHVIRLSQEKDWKTPFPFEKELEQYLNDHGISLEDKQREAVLRFAQKDGGFYLLLGSAGTGKTFTLKIILALLEKVFKANNRPFHVKILTPTGKAAKVATKATGFEAETIHRGLEYIPDVGFQRNELHPLEASVLVVDESSMLDVSLTSSLFDAIETGTKVILMGDIKQLPSIGAGNVLRDLANSQVVEKVILEVVKRQESLSGIIRNANHIIKGKMMETFEDTKDAFILHEEDDKVIQQKTLASIKRLLTYPDYNLEDIQVLSPQKRGSIGVYELNALFQSRFNPNVHTTEKIRNLSSDKVELYFIKGDKVIHTKNNYNKIWYNKTPMGYVPQSKPGITNGETGIIEDIDTVMVDEDGVLRKRKRMIVRYEGGYVFYHEGEEMKEIDHAYCLSIHKSQGSQWKAVIIPLSTQHAFFLDRNLVYTAWTRAMQFGTVIGPKRTLAISIKKDKAIERYTQLQNFLMQKQRIV